MRTWRECGSRVKKDHRVRSHNRVKQGTRRPKRLRARTRTCTQVKWPSTKRPKLQSMFTIFQEFLLVGSLEYGLNVLSYAVI